ncbi:MAG: serine/threonine protein kinase [Planctomycetaceae bacterium]|jgi:serine/threonine protein kinase
MNPSEPDSLDREVTRADSMRVENRPPSSLGDLSTNADLETSLSDLAGLDDGVEDVGEIVDLGKRYEISGALGRGGMGEVVRALDRRLDRGVAIKRLRSEFGKSQKAFRRFLTEAKSVAALNHYNIVQIYDFGQDSEGPFIVMELVEGQSLSERLSEGPIPLGQAIELTTQMCEALQAAHDRGIIHRDIKPANILVNEGGIPKLTDFGLARQETADQSTHTQAGTVLGTLDFMPPEQRTDASQANGQSDQWSLAATFYQMVSGELPRVIDGGSIPESVREITLRALKTKPGDRYDSIREFGQALQSANQPTSAVEANPLALAEGQCAGCGVSNDTSRQFCKGCGNSLQTVCPECEQPTAIWERFCGGCGVDIHALLHEQLAVADALRGEVTSLRRTYRHAEALAQLEPLLATVHPAFAEHRDWAGKTTETLRAEFDTLRQQRDQLVAAAREQLEQGRFSAAKKYVEQIPEPLRCDVAGSLADEIVAKSAESRSLGAAIQQAVKTRAYDGLLSQVDRYLILKPGDATAQKLTVQLQEREQKKESLRTSSSSSGGGFSEASRETSHETPLPGSHHETAHCGTRQRANNQTAIVVGGSVLLGLLLVGTFLFSGGGDAENSSSSREETPSQAARLSTTDESTVAVDDAGRTSTVTSANASNAVASTASSRIRWEHDGLAFEKRSAGTWREEAGNGATFEFTEGDRTSDYIELRGVTEPQVVYRLYPDRAMISRTSASVRSFVEKFRGGWRFSAGSSGVRPVTLSDSTDWKDWRCHQTSRTVPGDEGGWRLDGGELSTTDLPDHGTLWTAREFEDFELSLEYRLTSGANSGILFRGTGQWGTWGKAFLELQLLDEDGYQKTSGGVTLQAEQRNGSLYGAVAPSKSAGLPAGQWNVLVLRSVGSKVNATLNGSEIINVDLLESPQLKLLHEARPILLRPSGLIGLQKHTGNVAFRNVKIVEVSATSQESSMFIFPSVPANSE